LSLLAISGGVANDNMRVRAKSRKQLMLILVDSGSSTTFISSAMVKKLGLVLANCKPAKVKVANGEMLIRDSYVPQVE
jgi:predicted aspartyl protease